MKLLDIIVDPQKLNLFIKKSVSNFKKIHDDVHHGKLNYAYRNVPVKALPCDYVRIYHEKTFLSDNPVDKLINSYIVSCENKSIGSSIAFVENLFSNKEKKQKNFNRISKNDLINSLKYYVGDGIIFDCIMKCYDEMGHCGSVSFDALQNKKENKILVRSFSYKKIKCKINENFFINKFKYEDCVILAVDGSVDSMGFIDNLVQQLVNNKNNLVLIARNYDPDVINTLEYNFKNKNYNLIPFASSNDEVFEEIEKMKIPCIRVDNYDYIFSISLNEMQKFSILIEEDFLCLIDGEEDINKFVEVKIPSNMLNISGLIEDRILSGISFLRAASYSGLAQADCFTIPNISYNLALEMQKSLNSNFEKLGCILKC